MRPHRSTSTTLVGRLLAALLATLALASPAAAGGEDLDTLSATFLERALRSLKFDRRSGEGPSAKREELPVNVEMTLDLFRSALEGATQHAASRPALERILLPMAEFSMAHLRTEVALEVCARLVELRRRELGTTNPRVGDALARLGSALRLVGRHEEAEKTLKEALGILERQVDPDTEAMSRLLSNLALVYADSGRAAQGEALADQAVQLVTEGNDQPSSEPVATAFESQARVYYRLGRLDAAETALRRVLAVHERSYQDEWIPRQLHFLSLVFEDSGHPLEAYLVEKRSLLLDEKKAKRTLPVRAVRLDRMARLLEAARGPLAGRAPALRRQAADLRRIQLDQPRYEVAEDLEHLAAFYRKLGHEQEARLADGQALAIYRALGESGAPHAERLERQLGSAADSPSQDGGAP